MKPTSLAESHKIFRKKKLWTSWTNSCNSSDTEIDIPKRYPFLWFYRKYSAFWLYSYKNIMTWWIMWRRPIVSLININHADWLRFLTLCYWKCCPNFVRSNIPTIFSRENKKQRCRLCEDHLSSIEHLITMISTSIVRKCIHEWKT